MATPILSLDLPIDDKTIKKSHIIPYNFRKLSRAASPLLRHLLRQLLFLFSLSLQPDRNSLIGRRFQAVVGHWSHNVDFLKLFLVALLDDDDLFNQGMEHGFDPLRILRRSLEIRHFMFLGNPLNIILIALST